MSVIAAVGAAEVLGRVEARAGGDFLDAEVAAAEEPGRLLHLECENVAADAEVESGAEALLDGGRGLARDGDDIGCGDGAREVSVDMHERVGEPFRRDRMVFGGGAFVKFAGLDAEGRTSFVRQLVVHCRLQKSGCRVADAVRVRVET